MMYSELLSLTGDKATYKQFLNIEAAYMKDESMTKDQAAELWVRRYGKKEDRPLPAYLKMVKEAIRDFKDNRDIVNSEIARQEEVFNRKISEYDREDWVNEGTIRSLEGQKAGVSLRVCEYFGNDASIHIIYKDGSECIATGGDIVGGCITPKMQNIAYACYEDGDMEYDTLTGILVDGNRDFFGDLTTDEGIEAREKYHDMVEIKYGTEWGRKHAGEIRRY